MDTKNCTNLYIQVCQTLLTCSYENPTSFADLYKLLPWFRQSLTCCVCSGVLKDPMSSTESACQHFVCAQCNGKPMILKPSCSWCKDFTFFERNGHLAILVMCFAKVCDFINGSPILKHILRYEEEQKLHQDAEEGTSTSVTVEKNGKMIQKRRTKGKKRVYSGPRRRYQQLTFTLSQVLNDGMAIKTDLMDWLDKNVTASSDTTEMTPNFMKVQAELCLDTNALLLAEIEGSERNLDKAITEENE